MSTGAKLQGVLVTFRRPHDLDATLRQLASQSRRLDRLLIVDNDNDPSAHQIVAANSDAAKLVEYLPSAENIGPAGALALGCRELMRTADDETWVMFFDDDNPPRTRDGLSEILGFAKLMLNSDVTTGGVGLVGADFDIRSGLMRRLADHELVGPVPVSYIGGGQLPCYRMAAMRDVGVPNPALFFGFDDLEYGVRMREAGWNLYIDGRMLARERHVYGLTGTERFPSKKINSVSWRDYYSTRNLVWILRTHQQHAAAVRYIARRVVAKAIYNTPRSPRLAWKYILLGLRAAMDGYTGRLGKTIEPAASKTDM